MTCAPDGTETAARGGDSTGLFRLDETLEQRYYAALESIGITPPENYASLQGYVRESLAEKGLPATLAIDRTGFSPQAAAVLGGLYMEGSIILVSQRQIASPDPRKGAAGAIPSVERDYSMLSDMVDAASTRFRTLILSVLPNEALVVTARPLLAGQGGCYDLGEFLSGMASGRQESVIADPARYAHEVELAAATPSGALEIARSAVETLNAVDAETLDDFLLGERRDELMRCAAAMKSLGKLYGPDDIYRLAAAPASCAVPLASAFTYRGEDSHGKPFVAHVIPAKEPFLILSESLVSAVTTPFTVLSLKDGGPLMDWLLRGGYLELDASVMGEALHAIGLQTLEEAGYPEDIIRQCDSDLIMLHYELTRESVRVHLPEEWPSLKGLYLALGSAAKAGREPDREALAGMYSALPLDVKVEVSVPAQRAAGQPGLLALLEEAVPEMARRR